MFYDLSGTFIREEVIDGAALDESGSSSLRPYDRFGSAIANLEDFDGDLYPDIAVGAAGSHEAKGDVWLLGMHLNGTVKHQKQLLAGSPYNSPGGLLL